MSAEKCPVCGAEEWATIMPDGRTIYDCGKDGTHPCPNAERLAIELSKSIEEMESNAITAKIELAVDQPALIVCAYDMPIDWRPGDRVRIVKIEGGET